MCGLLLGAARRVKPDYVLSRTSKTPRTTNVRTRARPAVRFNASSRIGGAQRPGTSPRQCQKRPKPPLLVDAIQEKHTRASRTTVSASVVRGMSRGVCTLLHLINFVAKNYPVLTLLHTHAGWWMASEEYLLMKAHDCYADDKVHYAVNIGPTFVRKGSRGCATLTENCAPTVARCTLYCALPNRKPSLFTRSFDHE